MHTSRPPKRTYPGSKTVAMKIKFADINFSPTRLAELERINNILEDYMSQGYTLTLRQLYYQLVSKNIIANDDRQYKRVGKMLSDARMAGLVDWNAIEDRLRKPTLYATWESPRELLDYYKDQYEIDRLQGQRNYVEVWVEKDALSQVVKRACEKWQIPVMVNRGYGSSSAMYSTCMRIHRVIRQAPTDSVNILYLGDHDPSGLDMIRDVTDRLKLMLKRFGYDHLLDVKPIALTKQQIEEHSPPPNPAKLSDSRAGSYVTKHGYTSWEVDALPPQVLDDLIKNEVGNLLNLDQIEDIMQIEQQERDQITDFISEYYDDI